MRIALAGLIAALLVTGLPVAHAADEITACGMGGPTPGFKAIRFDLPEGADFISVEPGGSRNARVDDGSSWHLTKGAFIVNADTLELESYHVETHGISPRRAVVRVDGTTLVDQAVLAPDDVFYHSVGKPRSGLEPGTYYAIGFGSDGADSFPNDSWYFQVRVSGRHSCAPVGSGTMFDVDHTEFEGGTQVYAHAVGYAEGLEYSFDVPQSADIVVGLMDAGVQGALEADDAEATGYAELAYEMPGQSDQLDDDIEPFVSTGGAHHFEGAFRGIHPILLVAGVAIDLP